MLNERVQIFLFFVPRHAREEFFGQKSEHFIIVVVLDHEKTLTDGTRCLRVWFLDLNLFSICLVILNDAKNLF